MSRRNSLQTLSMSRIFLLMLATINLASGYVCPPGWVQWGDNCYYVSLRSNQYKTWEQAHDICTQMQGNLLSIESQEEFKWLSNILNEITSEAVISQQWWTGLTDQKVANDWVWSFNGEKMNIDTEIPWVASYPHQHNDQACQHTSCNHCALLTTSIQFTPPNRKVVSIRGLVEQGCKIKNPYICKRPNITTTPSKCDYADGWHHIDDSCWKLFKDRKVSWYDARDHCDRAENGRLATVHSKADHKSLLAISTEEFYKYWIGLQANKTGAVVEGEWTDGSAYSHDDQVTYWASAQPDFSRTSRGCVYQDSTKINDEGWHIDSCYDDRPFACQRPIGVCPPGWMTYNGRCYEFNQQNKRDWLGAKKYCDAQNTTLMIVDSADERRFLIHSGFLSRLDISAVWLGFEYYLNEYIWVNGEKVNMSALEIPESGTLNMGNKLCGVLITDGDGNMTVTDNCAQKFPFICEAAAVDSVIDFQHPPVDTFCEVDHYQYRRHCYKPYSTKSTWYEAQKACSNTGAKLVSISDSQEQAFLNTHMSRIYWIGMSGWGKTMKWRWQDASTPNTYRNFMIGYTRNLLPSANNCVNMNGQAGRYKGQWSTNDCNTKLPYICEKEGTMTPVTPPPQPEVDPDCGVGWVTPPVYSTSDTHLDSCYQLNKENLEWGDAQADCRNKGGQLASVLSPYEQTTVENYIPWNLAGAALWLGGSDQTTNSGWGWSDGKPFVYMNWEGIEQHQARTFKCVAMKLDTKTWHSIPCNAKMPYMCKKMKLSSTLAPPTIPPVTTLAPGMTKSCPADYDLIGNSCYKFYNQTSTQSEATKECKSDGAFLASAASELEDINEIHAGWVFKGHRDTPLWWIGLEDKDADGVFTWQDGSPVTYLDWGEHQPAEIYSSERCVMMTHTKATWEVRDCHDEADGFICKSAPLVTAATAGAVKIGDVCPPMANHMTDTDCYLMAYSQFNWETATGSCSTNSMELASFDSAEEAKYLIDSYRGGGARKVWLGYKNFNGTYLVDGAVVPTTSYMPLWNKDHTGNEFGKCVYISPYTGLLYDNDCNERMHFACKTKRLDYTPTPPTYDTSCPNDWSRIDDKCYKAFQTYSREEKKSWFDARDHCRALGGDLASIHAQNIDEASIKSMFQNEYDAVMKSEYWVGLHLLDRTKGYRWTDGSNFDIAMWEDGEPNNLRYLEPCTVANIQAPYNQPIVLSWNDKYCQGHHDYVCQIPTGTISGTLAPTTTLPTPKPITGVQGKCEPGWLQYTTICYKFKRDWFNWHEAKEDCQKEHGHLAVIHSKEQNDFIYSQITKRNEMHWTIGLTKYGDDQWGWVDGSAFDFVAWLEDEPSGHGGFENCGEMWHHAGFWNDYNCGMQHRGHICQRPVNGMTLPPTTTPQPAYGNCKHGFQKFGDKCYGVFGSVNPLNWTNAQTVCRMFGKGYDLTSVSSLQEQAYLGLETHRMNSSVWIGLADLLGFNTFVWSNSDAISETYWAPNSPGSGYNPRCTRLETDERNSLARWKPDTCDIKLPYACSGPLDKTILTEATTPASTICKFGYEEYDGECYKLITEPQTFDDAAEKCYYAGYTHLASVGSVSEQVYLQVMMAKAKEIPDGADLWIGMKRQEYYVNQLKVGQYEWQDKRVVKYSYWSENQPRHLEDVPNCVSINSTTGYWTSVNCEEKKMFICKHSTEPVITHSPQRYLCTNPNAVSYRDQCYTVHTPKYGKNFHQSSTQCVMEGMQLASIHDGDVQDFLTNLVGFSENPSQVWIGLVKNKRGSWIWSDGSEVEFEQWGPGQPSPGHKNQNDICGFLKYDDSLSLSYGANWTSDRCYASKGWICQEEGLLLTTPTPPTTFPTTTEKKYCDGDSNWKYFNESCYFVGNEKISWHDADDKCRSMSSELASLHGTDEIDAIFGGSWVSSYIAAIGLTKLGRANWAWTDKSLVDFSNWWEGEPNNHDGSERCAFMFTHTRGTLYEKGRWNDQHCNTLGAYVCKRPEVPKPIGLNPAIMIFRPGHCEADWVEYGNRCYKLISGKETAKNWTDARDDCRSRGPHADLVQVRNVKDQSFITSQLYQMDGNIWIGLNDKFWNRHFWWSNQHPVEYTNWVEGEPDVSDGDCIEMLLHRKQPGKWRTQFCSLKQDYMCVMDKDTRIMTPAPTPPSSLCQKGYREYFGACYKLYTSKVGWEDANNECANENAALVSVRNAYEQAFVESLLAYENDPVWIGLIEVQAQPAKNATSSMFLWDDGFPVTYTTWDDGRPIRAENNEMKCTTLNPLTGKWNDTFCYFSHAFVCKQTTELPTTPTPPSYKCEGDDMILFDDKCFKQGAGKDSWSDSHLGCLQMGMELASVHSYEETMFVLDKLYDRGLDDENIWLGMVRNMDGGYYWLDQSAVDWTYWSHNEPNDKYDSEACVEMVWRDNGHWNDLNCESRLHFLCEKPAIPFSTTRAPPTTQYRPPGRKTTEPKQPITHPSQPHHVTPLRPIITRRPRRTPAQLGGSTDSIIVKKGDQGPLIAGIIVALLILVAVGGVFAVFMYRKSKNSDSSNFNNWSGAHYKPGAEENGAAPTDGTLQFTNQLYDKDAAGGGGNGMELKQPAPTTSPGISVP